MANKRKRKQRGRTKTPTATNGVPTPRANRALLVGGLLVVSCAFAALYFFFGRTGPQTPEATAAVNASPLVPRDQPVGPASPTSTASSPGSVGSEAWQAMLDPSQDGWDTEVLHDRAKQQWKELGRWLEKRGGPDAPDVARLATSDFSCQTLTPATRQIAFEDAALRVERAEIDASSLVEQQPGTHQGPAGLTAALQELIKPWRNASTVHTYFKVFGVEQQHESFTTRQFITLSGQTDRGFVEQRATWDARWKLDSQASDPRLAWIGVAEFEQTITSPSQPTLYADCTASVLGDSEDFAQQLRVGTNHWLGSLQAGLGVDLFGHQGLAIGDVNGDGLDDLFVCQPGGLPNRLLIQNRDGTVTDVASHAQVDHLDRSRGALILDFDNNGRQDLAVILETTLVLMRNDGRGRFEQVSTVEVGVSTSLSAADYDSDGDLDVYVCGYPTPTGKNKVPVPYHDANNGERNLLLRNDGEFRFTDVTAEVGLDENNRRYSFIGTWEDYDNDGDPDLYVANDYGRNNLYRNEGGRFADAAGKAGVEDMSAGMGVTWGDYNTDGQMDLYVSNMVSSAGNRIAYQRNFRPRDESTTLEQFQRHARGNSLFENLGDGTFRDVSVAARVTMGRWAWSSNFVDINNDGWQDLVVANGMITNENPQDL